MSCASLKEHDDLNPHGYTRAVAKNVEEKCASGANAMKHLQARFTKFCKTSQFLDSILVAIVVKFQVLEVVIALKCSVL